MESAKHSKELDDNFWIGHGGKDVSVITRSIKKVNLAY